MCLAPIFRSLVCGAGIFTIYFELVQLKYLLANDHWRQRLLSRKVTQLEQVRRAAAEPIEAEAAMR